MRTIDFLPNHEDIKIIQYDSMFRINTDTACLGEFLEVYKEDVVLDIGTNNGALLMYASFFKPKKLIGIDINEEALALAKENLNSLGLTNYELIKADANNYVDEEVDVIICNPPYFKTRKEDLSKNQYLALAKHEDNLKLDSLIKTICKNLKLNGTLFMLFQTTRLDEIFSEFEKNKLNIKQLKFVYDTNKEYSNVVLIKAVKCGSSGLNVSKPIIIKR